MTDTKIALPESEIPTHYYNIAPDLPTPLPPPLHPGTKQPIGPEMLAPIFPMGLILQEVSQEPQVEIPDEVRDIYRLYRPTPVYRARAFEEMEIADDPSALRRPHSRCFESMMIVTGPSLIRLTSICAPNSPVATGLPRSCVSRAMNFS